MTFQLVYNERPNHSPTSAEGRRYWQTFVSEKRAENRAEALNKENNKPGRWITVEVGR